MSNIDVDSGAPAIYFHAFPHIMEHDAYSGDYGLGFFGSSLEAGATLVLDAQLGPVVGPCSMGTPCSVRSPLRVAWVRRTTTPLMAQDD